MSRKWDSEEAGKEVAKNLLSKMSNKPKFILLFSTIHYKKNGGFKKLVSSFDSAFPADVPVIGGTVAGFACRNGAFTRGVAALSFSGEMDVAVSIGRNTKRNSEGAANDAASSLLSQLASSAYKKGYFISLISSAKVPNLPVFNKKIVPHFPGISILISLFEMVSPFLQIGAGKDEQVSKKFGDMLEGFEGIGGASCDNLALQDNYQFFNGEVVSNSIVAAAFKTSQPLDVRYSLGMIPSGKKMTITDASGSGYVIRKINNEPALDAYLKAMGWPRSILDERLYRKIFYYPLVPTEGEIREPRLYGLVYGNSFIFPMRPLLNTELEINTFSGKGLLQTFSTMLPEKKKSAFIVSCGTRLETLGANVFKVVEKLNSSFSSDYLVIYTAGEYNKTGNRSQCLYLSDNALIVS